MAVSNAGSALDKKISLINSAQGLINEADFYNRVSSSSGSRVSQEDIDKKRNLIAKRFMAIAGAGTFANATILKKYLAALRSKNIPISQTTADAVIHDYGGTLWKWTGEK